MIIKPKKDLKSFLLNLPLIVLFFIGALACGGSGGGGVGGGPGASPPTKAGEGPPSNANATAIVPRSWGMNFVTHGLGSAFTPSVPALSPARMIERASLENASWALASSHAVIP